MRKSEGIYGESTVYAFYKCFLTPQLRPVSCRTVSSIFCNFFLRQHIAAFLPGRIPVSKADHEIDGKIPFTPSWITIYIDFTQFWIRMLSFYLRRYGRKAYKIIADFIKSIGDLYAYAAEVYTKNFSTTKRPFYIARARFLLIHLVDPHLMCIPSLHVMVVIHTYKQFIAAAKELGVEEKYKDQIEVMKQGALAISRAILFVKQHSVNCVPTALYAMTCFSPEHFPPKEAEEFINLLFSPASDAKEKVSGALPEVFPRVHPAASPKIKISDEDQEIIKKHIMSLYRSFLSQRDASKPWYDPLLEFLKKLPKI
ncbi:MAG: hypothetical protein FWD26_04860 [Treponema sp.]|nr:hypothetical protein [Treponema sp.]